MKKKLLAGLVMLMTSIPLAGFAHGDDDQYDAMCQSTGAYHTPKYAYEDYAKNHKYMLLQLFGHCGEQPNYLEIDNVLVLNFAEQKRHKALERHTIEFWASPKKGDPTDYWQRVFGKTYYTNAEGRVVKTVKSEYDHTRVLVVKQEDIHGFVIVEHISAKIGGPLFESALGPIPCVRGSEQEGLLEQGYLDYQKLNKNI